MTRVTRAAQVKFATYLSAAPDLPLEGKREIWCVKTLQAKLEGYKRLGDGSSIELADMEFDKQKTLQDQFLAAIKRTTTEITKVSNKRKHEQENSAKDNADKEAEEERQRVRAEDEKAASLTIKKKKTISSRWIGELQATQKLRL